jgi:hypothetical protein
LKKEVLECEVQYRLRLQPYLRIYKLEFITLCLYDKPSRFWAHTNPIDTRRRLNGAVGLHCNFKVEMMKGFNQGLIDL